MDTSNPLPSPVTVTPQRAATSATMISNVLAMAAAWLAAPELINVLNAVGVHDAGKVIASIVSALALVNMALRWFKTKAPIAGSSGEAKARAEG